MKIYCFMHHKYRGKESPQLSCKTCCQIFLAEVKRQGKKGREKFAGQIKSKSR